jgi:RNA polymerase sigma-70 factor (ECF subfamily)
MISREERSATPNAPDGHAPFTPTRWSIVYGAKQWPAPEAYEALSQLCEIYRPPVYAFLQRRYTTHDADDLTQGFFAQMLRKDFLKNVDGGKGRFRSFILKCLKHYLINQHAKDSAKPTLIFPGHDAESDGTMLDTDALIPNEGFDQKWALALVQRVFQTLADEFARKDRLAFFTRLRTHLTGDLEAVPYAALAAEFQIPEGTLRKAVHDLRHRFGELLREEVAETVATRAEIDEELRHIMGAWIRSGAPQKPLENGGRTKGPAVF